MCGWVGVFGMGAKSNCVWCVCVWGGCWLFIRHPTVHSTRDALSRSVENQITNKKQQKQYRSVLSAIHIGDCTDITYLGLEHWLGT